MNAMDKNILIAEAYYQAIGRKNISDMAQFLHPDVEFIAPLAKTKGKESLLEAVEKFFSLFNTLTIHAKLGDGDKAMIVYELECPKPIGKLRAAALLSFEAELISCVELFYDARPFTK